MHNIFITGSEYHCNMVKKILSDNPEINFTDDLKSADILYVIFGPGISKETLKYWILTNKPILIHWIGKDTFFLEGDRKYDIFSKGYYTNKLKKIILNARYLFNNVKFISSAPWLAKRVNKLTNKDTDYLVLTSIDKNKLLTPRKKRKYDFISYIPINDFELYYGNEFLSIIENNPKREFCIVCPDLHNLEDWPYKKYSNLKIQTRTTQKGFYECLNNSKSFIRLKNGGDAIALSVLEALAHGCNVVWNLDFKFCSYETRESFKHNYQKYFVNDFEINYSAIKFIKENYDITAWQKDFISLVNKILK
ncbi:hypothetical protein SAMN04515654_12829 [Halanaerobium congolense]|uniref:Uncharacterized protein n=1 Tax=Halanaerobium congolense TaxID=54121 RepID=A0A1G8R3B6_9FIRM|nr:hypothetical protein [Halanaerobium congolense]SDJ11461.1 hypothetical protein SAMN04515654_12829 [Halanaerobium congolense]SET66142.1 hypothetical protein SAMN04515653_12339 [Halanaerobium congolense]